MTAPEAASMLRDSVLKSIIASWRERGSDARRHSRDDRCLAVYDELERRGEEFAREIEAVMR